MRIHFTLGLGQSKILYKYFLNSFSVKQGPLYCTTGTNRTLAFLSWFSSEVLQSGVSEVSLDVDSDEVSPHKSETSRRGSKIMYQFALLWLTCAYLWLTVLQSLFLLCIGLWYFQFHLFLKIRSIFRHIP